MSFTTHQNWTHDSYQNDRNYYVKRFENEPLAVGVNLSGLQPHQDSGPGNGTSIGDSIAIGYGLDLLVRDNSEINSILSAAGLATLSSGDESLLRVIPPFITGVISRVV